MTVPPTPQDHPQPPPPPLAGRKEWTALGVLMLPLLLVSMDVSVLYFAIPFISQDLAPSATQQLWILDVYGFVLSGLLITMGTLGDRIGRRRLLLSGAVAFGAASVAAAYASTPDLLIAARALLGVGGATLMPSTLALIRNLFRDSAQRAKAVTLWTAVMAAGISLGPVLSGVLLEHFWWGSLFLINLPAMLLLLVLAPFLLPEFKSTPRPGFDLLSALLSLAAVLPVVYGIKEVAKSGIHVLPLVHVAAGVALGLLFVRRQRSLAQPMIDLTMIRRRAFGGAVVANVLAMFATVGFAVFFNQYLQSVLGMRPLEAALWSLVPSGAAFVCAPVGAMLAGRINRAHVMAGGFAIAAAGFVWLTQVRTDSPLWFVLTGCATYVGGIITAMTLANEMALGAAPPERAGAAASVIESGTEFGGALGMAVLGSIGAAVYTREMAGPVTGPGAGPVPEAVRETLGGAVAAARHLPAAQAESLLASAREAFTQSLNYAALGAAVFMLLAAACAVMMLRHGADPGTPAPASEPLERSGRA
ncbi:DHA2 family multidrug resistance protein-like MFS transporter [Streptomyces candidus]|uniref:DHA2 family multidrug resistance protein-like MFS transporter n=2 Tax=Streptomyces candidus TaxID=67283 RepID=A0A7X0LRX7_9ACTN|nr:DHA2 family multidrug resistance protein-like MFS transporter [Streptomyces candidus]GHH45457.1 MFS transporter [Streptomyces candidus]